MVYNAMKLFMEINPQLFDDCSHDYTEHQNNAEAREQAREANGRLLLSKQSIQRPTAPVGPEERLRPRGRKQLRLCVLTR